ncbi:GNAT family N-acetyltransferase [Microbacterium sp. 22242]|uniref:GNAT family N-acetyltransferase n=1 Tax=Microbacterium sp. 22242 TaxID=3453896 RepID=UPI003F840E05
MSTPAETRTDRLLLRRPEPADRDAVFAINADPRLWTHFPSLRPTEPAQIDTMIERWLRGWESRGLGSWVVRLRETGEVIGNGGCTMIGSDPDDPAARLWNLGYRLSADHHGRGLATELSRAALAAAARIASDVPVIAYLVAHNRASAGVAEKVGLQLVHRAPDPGNPDPSVTRLVYADRPLTAAQLATAMR